MISHVHFIKNKIDLNYFVRVDGHEGEQDGPDQGQRELEGGPRGRPRDVVGRRRHCFLIGES